MKRHMKRGLALLLALMMTLSTMSVMAMAAGTNVIDDSKDKVINVTDSAYGANGDDETLDTGAFNKAMKVAQETEGTLTVNIPAGTYYLGDTVLVYSNTKIVAAEGATIIRRGYSKNLLGAGLSDSGDGSGYTRAQNITISGGVWDGGESDPGQYGNLFYFYHCQNVTIEGATLQNCWGADKGGHHIDFSGIQDGTVRNCTFKDYHETDGTNTDYLTAEAVHTDFTSEDSAYSAEPYDYTPCKNIVVDNCTFENCCSGVGYHAPDTVNASKAENITVTNNTFTDLWGVCVHLPYVNGAVVSGNTANDVRAFCYISHSSTGIEISGNTIDCKGKDTSNDVNQTVATIHVDNSQVTITGNTIENAVTDAIRIFSESETVSTDNGYIRSTANIKNNIINNPSASGIYVEESEADIEKNEITGASEYGIYCHKNCNLTAKENTVTGCKYCGIRCIESDVDIYCNTTSNNDTNEDDPAQYVGGIMNIIITDGSGTKTGTLTIYSDTDQTKLYYDNNFNLVVLSEADPNKGFTGFKQDGSNWYYYENGAKTTLNSVLKGTVNGQDGWWYVVGGMVQLGYTGVTNYGNSSGYWYVREGKVDFTKNSVEKNSNGWWYVVGGKVQFDYTGVTNYGNSSGYWYVKEGKVDFTKNSVEKNSNGWWYVVGGKVQFDYTGVTDYGNSSGYWYVRGGKVDFTKTSVEQNSYGWWRVVDGKVDFSCNSVEQNDYGWWYLIGGKVQFGYTGVANYANAYGWWYVKDGKVDFSKTSVEQNNYGWWRVVNGKVDFSCNSVEQNDYGWWYIAGGKVQFGYTGVANYANAYGWWYVKDGKVNFSYNGWAKNSYGTWYCANGKVDFSKS